MIKLESDATLTGVAPYQIKTWNVCDVAGAEGRRSAGLGYCALLETDNVTEEIDAVKAEIGGIDTSTFAYPDPTTAAAGQRIELFQINCTKAPTPLPTAVTVVSATEHTSGALE